MLRSLNELIGYDLAAQGGELGHIHDFLFDHHEWTTRYLVVDTGKWLPGRKVLIAPLSVLNVSAEDRTIAVELTREQVRSSPEIDPDQPLSEPMEQELTAHYGWPAYWQTHALMGVPAGSGDVSIPRRAPSLHAESEWADAEPEDAETHLRSVKRVRGSHLHASDGEIGHVEDFIADDESWAIRYMVVDTRNWLPGRKVLIAPPWIDSVNWRQSAVRVNLTREAVKNSPAFEPDAPVNRDYEERLYGYYGQPVYWRV